MQPVTQFLKNALTNLTAVGAILHGAKVGMFVNTPVPTVHRVFGDLTECTFTGYAQVACVFSAGYAQADGSWALVTQLFDFQPTDAVTPNVAKGWFMVDSAGNLLFLELFPTPIALPDASSVALFVVELKLDQAGNWGAATVLA